MLNKHLIEARFYWLFLIPHQKHNPSAKIITDFIIKVKGEKYGHGRNRKGQVSVSHTRVVQVAAMSVMKAIRLPSFAPQ